MDLTNDRIDYKNEGDVFDATNENDPFELFVHWYKNASDKLKGEELNAICLSTVDIQTNRPSSRMVLMKKFDEDGLVFFTNSQSRKGKEIMLNRNVSCCIYWSKLHKQIRLEGECITLEQSFSDEYFNKRPVASRISAVISEQSQPIHSRKEMVVKANKLLENYERGDCEIKRQSEWNGYRIVPDTFEFWQGQTNRLHDRIQFKLNGKKWKSLRLQP
ncbi:hypothetical protein SNEBB_008999 [Seison nebaliae]|nr:hypothetical protein SNEBB_008999 [Seison nebaliae]